MLRKKYKKLCFLSTALLTISFSCSSNTSTEFNQETFEELIPALLIPEDPGLITAIECPALIETQSTCTANIGDTQVSFIVEGPDSSGGINVVTEFGLIWAEEVSQELKGQLDSDLGISHQVICDPKVRIAEEGQSFSCIVTDPSEGTHVFTVKVNDSLGNLDLQLIHGTSNG